MTTQPPRSGPIRPARPVQPPAQQYVAPRSQPHGSPDPTRRKTSKFAVTAFVLSILYLLSFLGSVARPVDYPLVDVARAFGYASFLLIFSMIVIALAVAGKNDASNHGMKGGGIAIAAIVLACLPALGGISRIAALMWTTVR